MAKGEGGGGAKGGRGKGGARGGAARKAAAPARRGGRVAVPARRR